MRDPVFMKSSRYGIVLYFDPDVPYEELLMAVQYKFRSAEHFFARADMLVEFNGRVFTKEEERRMAEAIEEAGKVHILCIIEKDPYTEAMHKRMLDDSKEALHAKDGMFYRGTLRGRQILEAETSIVIIGDVEEDATVVSKGHVVVTGTVRGTVIAGAGDHYDAVIAALHMRPRKLKVGDVRLKPIRGGSYSWAKLL